MKIDISFLPGAGRGLHAGVRAHRHHGDAAAGARRDERAGARAADAWRSVLAAVLLPLHRNAYQIDLRTFGPVLAHAGEEMFIGAVLGLTARLTDLGAAGRGLRHRPAAWARLRHGGRSDAGPAERDRRQFPDHARHHAGVRDRPASPGDRRAQRQLCAVPSRRNAAPRRRGRAHHRTVALAFRIGIQLSAPFIVFGLLFNLGLGVLSRLMPQMQVFFVGLPALDPGRAF